MAGSEDLDAQRSRAAARQQLLFREVNERIDALSEGAMFSEYVCECAQQSCNVAVSLSVDEYLAVRADPTQFLIVCGRWSGAFDRIVFETERYIVVKKTGAGALMAERTAHDRVRPDPTDAS